MVLHLLKISWSIFRSGRLPAQTRRFCFPANLSTLAKKASKVTGKADTGKKDVNEPAHVRVGVLRNQLHAYNASYVAGKPSITDEQYDSLFRELETLEQRFPTLITCDSPTQRVDDSLLCDDDDNSKEGKGSETVLGSTTSVLHHTPMLSLRNITTDAEVEDFDQSIRRELGVPFSEDIDYVMEIKYDGMAISLVYSAEDGNFLRAITRGNGLQGEDVTENALRYIKNLPRQLNLDDIDLCNLPADNEQQEYAEGSARRPVGLVEVRGEVLLSKPASAQLGARENESALGPARNKTVGLLRRKHNASPNNVDVAQDAGLITFFAYSLYMIAADSTTTASFSSCPSAVSVTGVGAVDIASHSGRLVLLARMGFTTDPHCRLAKGVPAMLSYLHEWRNSEGLRRLALAEEYGADGMVLKVDSIHRQRQLGFRTRTPRWAAAFKFAGTAVSTCLLGLTLQVGRSGRVTPVAAVEPIYVGGALVSRVSLHNLKVIEKLGLRIGSTVFIEQMGGVIPQITSALPFAPLTALSSPPTSSSASSSVDFPVRGSMVLAGYETASSFQTGEKNKAVQYSCPCSQKSLLVEESSGMLFCVSPSCALQQLGSLIYFCGAKAMDLEGLGVGSVTQLLEEGILTCITDVFRLTEKEKQQAILALPGWKEKRLNKIVQCIETRRETARPAQLLVGLSIPHVGSTQAERLLRHFQGSLSRLLSATEDELHRVDGIGEKIAASIVSFQQTHRQLLQDLHALQLPQLMPDATTTAASASTTLVGEGEAAIAASLSAPPRTASSPLSTITPAYISPIFGKRIAIHGEMPSYFCLPLLSFLHSTT